MVPSGVTPEEIQTAYGHSLTPAQMDQVAQWISDAELLINARLGVDKMNTIDTDLYGFVVRQAVIRRLERADVGSASSTTVSVDDASVTRRYDEGRPAGGPYWWFLTEWWELINPSETGAFSTRPTFEPGRAGDGPDWWFEVGNHQGPSI